MKKLILILFGLFVVISCSTSDDNSNNSEIKVNFDKETFDKKRTLWQAQNLQNYSYTFEHFSSTGPYQYDVVVENGVVTSEEGRTIESLFTDIESTYNNLVQEFANGSSNPIITGVSFTITYNSQYYYPESISVSYSYSQLPPPGLGGYTNEIKNFQITE